VIIQKYKTWYIAMSGDRKKAAASNSRTEAMTTLAKMLGLTND
jgi:hypothetical protein